MKRLIGLLAWALGLVPAAASPAWAGPTLSLEDAVTRALRHNPRVEQARLRVEQARLDAATQAWWWARAVRTNVNVGLGGPGTPTVTAEGTLLPTAAVGLFVNLGDIVTAPLASTQAQQALQLAEADQRAARLEVTNQIAQAHAEHEVACVQAGLAALAIEAAEAEWRVTERQFARGLVGAGALARARLARASARAEATRTASLQARAWAQLATLVADPALALTPSLALDRR